MAPGISWREPGWGPDSRRISPTQPKSTAPAPALVGGTKRVGRARRPSRRCARQQRSTPALRRLDGRPGERTGTAATAATAATTPGRALRLDRGRVEAVGVALLEGFED